MSKFNMAGLVKDIQKQFKDSSISKRIGVGTDLTVIGETDTILMPEWFQTLSGISGLPFGKLVTIAGDTDSGKTSAAIDAMKSAQQQSVGIIYVETEGKTTTKDLTDWGVDPSNVLLVQSSITEEAFQLLFKAWDSFRDAYPNEPLLVIFDSIGNVISQRDSELDLVEQSSQPGGKGKINRIGINRMIARRYQGPVALLLISYTYDNMGSPGKTTAGGKAINLFSSLIFHTSRKGWAEKQIDGKKVRIGAEVVWKLFKNHLNRSATKQKEFTLRITSEGIKVVG